MPQWRILPTLKPGVLLATLLPLTGCLSEGPTEGSFEVQGPIGEQSSRGVSLSQAMQASASGSHESLGGKTYTPVDTSVNAAVSVGSGGGSAVPAAKNDDMNFTYQVPMDVAYAVPFNGDIQSITKFTLTPISLENDRYCIGLFLSGDIVDLEPGSLPASAIKDTRMYEAGMSGRIYLNRAHAFVSPYFSGSMAYQLLTWNYINPVYSGNDKIQSDALQAIGIYAGFGVAFNRNSHLSFFGEAGFGGTAFTDQTVQGFNNDVFDSFGYFTVKAGLAIKF